MKYRIEWFVEDSIFMPRYLATVNTKAQVLKSIDQIMHILYNDLDETTKICELIGGHIKVENLQTNQIIKIPLF